MPSNINVIDTKYTGYKSYLSIHRSIFTIQLCRLQYGSIFIRVAVVASEICEITRNSEKITTYSTSTKVIQGHRSWCQSKVHVQLPAR